MKSKKSIEPRVGIVTINDPYNLGNRLQSFALQYELKKLGFSVETLSDTPFELVRVLRQWKTTIVTFFHDPQLGLARKRRKKKNRRFSKKMIGETPWLSEYFFWFFRHRAYHAMIVGSDQVWNPRFGHLLPVDLLEPFKTGTRVAYAASFGADDLNASEVQSAETSLRQFDALSVRETSGKFLLEGLTGREDVEILMDPTMFLTAEEWMRFAKKPRRAPKGPFVLCYFLGDITAPRSLEIAGLAEQMDCSVVDLTDPASRAYTGGPAEFLWYMGHAELVCTDSFHGCIFAILNEKTLRKYPREGACFSMESRMQTLESKLELHGETTDTCIVYSEFGTNAARLEYERNRGLNFLKNALGMNLDL